MSIEMEDRGRALENEYFRRKEQEIIEKMKARLLAENSKDSERSCPNCDGKLVETDYESVKIDICNRCHGVWLDAGELAQIAHKDNEGGSLLGRLFG
jgi:ribosomal protein L31